MAEPPITVQAYHVSSGSNYPVHRVVIHATAPGLKGIEASANGEAHSTAEYFRSASSGGSAHYIRDGVREEHCVRDGAIAWHAPPNPGSIGIEICAEATYSPGQWTDIEHILDVAAVRVAELCHRFGIPVVKINASDLLAGKRGICGHVDVSQAWHQSDHTDPGHNFPWGYFISKVKAHYGTVVPAPKPVVPGHQQAPRFPGRILRLGVHGDDVHAYQVQMLHRGWKAIGVADGQYGPKCVAVTRAFQQEKHLGVDGMVGPATWNAAFISPIT